MSTANLGFQTDDLHLNDETLTASLQLETRRGITKYLGFDPAMPGVYDVADVNLFSNVWTAVARRVGTFICNACGDVTLAPDGNTYGEGRLRVNLCPDCTEEVDDAIHNLPDWVRDQDLGPILQAFGNAFAREKNKSIEGAAR